MTTIVDWNSTQGTPVGAAGIYDTSTAHININTAQTISGEACYSQSNTNAATAGVGFITSSFPITDYIEIYVRVGKVVENTANGVNAPALTTTAPEIEFYFMGTAEVPNLNSDSVTMNTRGSIGRGLSYRFYRATDSHDISYMAEYWSGAADTTPDRAAYGVVDLPTSNPQFFDAGWWNFRFYVEKLTGRYKFKSWKSGTSEPSSWQVDATPAGLTIPATANFYSGVQVFANTNTYVGFTSISVTSNTFPTAQPVNMKGWTGTSWKPAYIWNGSSWVQPTGVVKKYNGSSWVIP